MRTKGNPQQRVEDIFVFSLALAAASGSGHSSAPPHFNQGRLGP
jgi:hypothetical protein